jgi:hypothetical protein
MNHSDADTPTVVMGGPARREQEQQQFLLCEQCQAPVDRDQRYCVRCGTRQTHAANPAVGYFAADARRRRTGNGAPPSRGSGGVRALVFALFFALLPLAVGIGVLVGRGDSGANDKLIAALEKQKPVVVAAPGAAAPGASPSTAASTPSTAASHSGNLPSDFSLGSGFVVKLSTLPVRGTQRSAVTRAEQAARAKGATNVGLINPKDFTTTPKQGSTNYIIYSGQFKTRAEAQRALAKLKPRFPTAEVIAVGAVGGGGGGTVVAHTEFGTVHKVAGFKPTAHKVAEDKKVVQKINHEVGKNYVNAQKGLPDTIVVTGSPNSTESGSTGTNGAGEP